MQCSPHTRTLVQKCTHRMKMWPTCCIYNHASISDIVIARGGGGGGGGLTRESNFRLVLLADLVCVCVYVLALV